MALRIIPDDTHIPFMRYARIFFAISMLAMALSMAAAFFIGMNQGIDFNGGTLIELRSRAPAADLAQIRSQLNALDLGEVEIQTFGNPNDVLIRLEAQPGGDAAQQEAVRAVQQALGNEAYEYRRVEVVGPRVSGELATTGTIAVIFTLLGVLLYIWFRFEWQFALGAIATLVHDCVLTIGFYVVTQFEFNVSSIAAVLTILGYSLNDTVVVYDRIRELLRRYKQMPLPDLLDLAINQTLSRTVLTALTTGLALTALLLFGGEVIRSFAAGMLWGVVIGTYSSIFISAPVLIFFKLRAESVAPPQGAPVSR